ncbi:type II secretion system protein [Paraherbaspirillum soli]|uniref:Type II secretion system protein n=1 Tax=Paraherbaspirillum soli TaxID=631222 RepID=A0ABW0M9T7_9BURK
MKPFKTDGGFAYLWVLLLVAIMGLGLTVGVDIYTTSVTRDKEAELLAIGRQFRVAIGRYYETQLGSGGKREYPASLEDLLRDNRSPGLKRHLRQVFVDPMTGSAEWGLVRVAGRIVGVHSLSAKMPIKQDHFEADDMSFRGKEKYSDWVFTYPSDLLLRTDVNGLNGAEGKELKPVDLKNSIGAPPQAATPLTDNPLSGPPRQPDTN